MARKTGTEENVLLCFGNDEDPGGLGTVSEGGRASGWSELHIARAGVRKKGNPRGPVNGGFAFTKLEPKGKERLGDHCGGLREGFFLRLVKT